MQDMQHILDQIPIRHNLISYLMAIGITFSLVLSTAILIRASQKNAAFKLLAGFLICMALIVTDIFLCYTGLMKYYLHWNDSTEPLVLLLAPLVYLFILGILVRQPFSFKKHGWHFIPAVLYAITQIGYYLQPVSVKLNAYLGAYFREIPMIEIPPDLNFGYHLIKDHFRWILLASFIIYIILTLVQFRKNLKPQKTASNSGRVNKYALIRFMLISLVVVFALIFVIYLNYEDDGGDHYIALFVSLTVLISCFVFIAESRFFENSWLADKYETLPTENSSISIDRIKTYVETNDYYLLQTASLKDLSRNLSSSPNYISKSINESTGSNFNDFINHYRIKESKKRLLDQRYKHLTIEAIGNSVGFKSKSAFYTAFKKHNNMSPTSYVQENRS